MIISPSLIQQYKPSNHQQPTSVKTSEEDSNMSSIIQASRRHDISPTKMLRDITKICVREFVDNMNLYSQMMLKSKGRNKVFALAQYVVELYIKTMTYS